MKSAFDLDEVEMKALYKIIERHRRRQKVKLVIAAILVGLMWAGVETYTYHEQVTK